MFSICDGISWEVERSANGFAVFPENIAGQLVDSELVDAIQSAKIDNIHDIFSEKLFSNPFANLSKDGIIYACNDRPHLLAKFTYRSGLGTLVVNTALGEGFRKLNSQTFGAPDYYGYVEEDSSVSEYTGAIIMQRVEGHPLSAVSFSRYQYSTIDTTCYRAISEVGIAPTAVHWDLHPMNLISSDPRLERGPFVDDARVYVIDQASRVPIQLG